MPHQRNFPSHMPVLREAPRGWALTAEETKLRKTQDPGTRQLAKKEAKGSLRVMAKEARRACCPVVQRATAPDNSKGQKVPGGGRFPRGQRGF